MRENHLRWYEHTLRKYSNVVFKRGEMINVSSLMRGRGRPKNKVCRTTVYRLVRAVCTSPIGDQYGWYLDTPPYTVCRYAWYDLV